MAPLFEAPEDTLQDPSPTFVDDWDEQDCDDDILEDDALVDFELDDEDFDDAEDLDDDCDD